jgi:hypothetical protein
MLYEEPLSFWIAGGAPHAPAEYDGVFDRGLRGFVDGDLH